MLLWQQFHVNLIMLSCYQDIRLSDISYPAIMMLRWKYFSLTLHTEGIHWKIHIEASRMQRLYMEKVV
jgi:hypothetical protein